MTSSFLSLNLMVCIKEVGFQIILCMDGPSFPHYTSNYKCWKEKFLWVRGGSHSLKVIYEEDETY